MAERLKTDSASATFTCLCWINCWKMTKRFIPPSELIHAASVSAISSGLRRNRSRKVSLANFVPTKSTASTVTLPQGINFAASSPTHGPGENRPGAGVSPIEPGAARNSHRAERPARDPSRSANASMIKTSSELLVVPKSHNHQLAERVKKFTPTLRFLEYMGNFRNKDTAIFNEYDLC